MKSLITKELTLAFITLFYASTSFAQYSNATLNGQWFMHNIPVTVSLDSVLGYMGFDGNGIITDCCTFGTVDGSTYSVSSPGGAISGSLITHDISGDVDTAQFSVQLSSVNYATLNVGGMILGISRILTPGALTDSLVGMLSSPSPAIEMSRFFWITRARLFRPRDWFLLFPEESMPTREYLRAT